MKRTTAFHLAVMIPRRSPQLVLAVGVWTIALLAWAAPVYAADMGAISQTYTATAGAMSAGELVSSIPGKTGTIASANAANAARLAGVVTTSSLIELSSPSSGSTVRVIVDGPAQALVSDLNGPVDAGDKIAPAPIDGVGMKAISSGEIVGTALANLSSVKTVTRTMTARDGKQLTIKIGLLPITVSVAYYAVSSSGGDKLSTLLPPILQSLAEEIAGQNVSPLRVLLGALALILGFCIVGIMSYVGVRSGFSSIGRNPLAERSILRGFVDLAVTIIGVLVVTVVTAYVVLIS